MFCLSWLVQFFIIFSFNSFTFSIANIFFRHYFGICFYIFYPTFYFFNLSIWNFDLKLEFVNFQNSISQKKLAIGNLSISNLLFQISNKKKKKIVKKKLSICNLSICFSKYLKKKLSKKIVNLQFVNVQFVNLQFAFPKI